MAFEEELKELFINSSTEIMPNKNCNQLEIRLMTFTVFKNIIEEKMNEAYYHGQLSSTVGEGNQQC
jgi:hypothetical protein